MANTEALLALQAEYPTAFADPEAAPPDLASTDSGLGRGIAANLGTMNPDQVCDFAEEHLRAVQAESDEDDETDYELGLEYLAVIADQSKILVIAVDLLKRLADIVGLIGMGESGILPHVFPQKDKPVASAPVLIKGKITSIKERPGIVLDLPETHARQGSAECPGGLCDL